MLVDLYQSLSNEKKKLIGGMRMGIKWRGNRKRVSKPL